MIRLWPIAALLLLAACDKPAEVSTSSAPQPATVTNPESAGEKTCAQERGADEARILANRCRMVSGATRPPCHPNNTCAVMELVIVTDCAAFDPDAVPAECVGPTEVTRNGEVYNLQITDQ